MVRSGSRIAMVGLFALVAWACASAGQTGGGGGDGVDGGEQGPDGSTFDGRPGSDARPRPDARPDGPDATPADACVLGTVESCSQCGVACDGLGQTGANVSCAGDMCVFSCQGETYDVNGDPADGCEKSDTPTGNHQEALATYVGSLPCTDGSSNPNVRGTMHSDTRVHENPAVPGFVIASGAARDWYRIYADGGSLCQNEVVLTLAVSGTGNRACYKLIAKTNKGTNTCTTNSAGSCTINQNGTGEYSDNTNIFLTVEKTCSSASAVGSVTYSITGHL